MKNGAESNCNCVAARRGGEQRNENDQSETQDGHEVVRRELDSVGGGGASVRVKGEACRGGRKSAGSRAIPGRRVDGWRRNGWKSSCDNQGDPPGSSGVRGGRRPKNRPAGVRASVVAEKRVTIYLHAHSVGDTVKYEPVPNTTFQIPSGAAHQRWPNEWFARRGLLSLAAEHEWTRTIVGLRTH